MDKSSFVVPRGYYIEIDGGPMLGNRKMYRSQKDYDVVHTAVYHSIDHKDSHTVYGNPRIEHVEKIGEFEIHNHQSMKLDKFLSEVRMGIEKLIKRHAARQMNS